jgi:putative ABC transport system permease protein
MLVSGALLVYVDTRQRKRSVAEALLVRMGVPTFRHWRALLAELGALVTISVVMGTALGWWAVRAVNDHLDAAPRLPPGPLLRYPSVTTALVVAAGFGTVVVVASWAQRAAGRTNLGEALREDV